MFQSMFTQTNKWTCEQNRNLFPVMVSSCECCGWYTLVSLKIASDDPVNYDVCKKKHK